MQRWNGLSQVPAGVGPSVVTIGNFDGVHRGHGLVIDRLKDRARELSARAVAITFDPHPAQVHRPDEAPPLICGLTDRLDLLEAAGLDGVLVLPYTLEFARLTPRDFVEEYIVGALGACSVAVGRDVRFGLNNSGTLATMTELGRELGFTVEVIDDAGTVGAGADGTARWSSSAVRELLLDGDVAGAARVLGRPHRLRAVVVHGEARGRELGFPTANLSRDAEGMVPADGVYAGWVRRPSTDDVALPAAISIGTNPTFDGVARRVEAYVLDRTDLDLYDEEILVDFVAHLRPTLRFDGLEALIATMHDDVTQAREILGVAAPEAARPGTARPGAVAAD